MCTMTPSDILKLANNARQARVSMDEPTRCYYAWVNDGLIQRYFSRGKARFIALLDSMVNHPEAIHYDPWSHVGKNH